MKPWAPAGSSLAGRPFRFGNLGRARAAPPARLPPRRLRPCTAPRAGLGSWVCPQPCKEPLSDAEKVSTQIRFCLVLRIPSVGMWRRSREQAAASSLALPAAAAAGLASRLSPQGLRCAPSTAWIFSAFIRRRCSVLFHTLPAPSLRSVPPPGVCCSRPAFPVFSQVLVSQVLRLLQGLPRGHARLAF